MLQAIDQWIDKVNQEHELQRTCCIQLKEALRDFYTKAFLEQAFFVVVETLPKPQFLKGHVPALDNFLNQKLDGITYKNTYYILPHVAEDIRTHFHELVHVAQWQTLGANRFISQYIEELAIHGYRNAPVEVMAYDLEDYFMVGGNRIDVPLKVELDLKREF